jgi:hypothetical protein
MPEENDKESTLAVDVLFSSRLSEIFSQRFFEALQGLG